MARQRFIRPTPQEFPSSLCLSDGLLSYFSGTVGHLSAMLAIIIRQCPVNKTECEL
ncbi:hypothetical protein CKO_00288 [Citrobacter koseri ATCC BAA-895]|uniref:Uncharacterized protein n=1 Tax=Citrobacter koseri (strain ATCC BAA-895 / CDC 4225-83 / SGSC4696) TaxID=290338 RepID=A8AD88_CITK8|nr:hypothetical protein CKO_00288 [Citrobacter koseri ATCC BAA-895]